MLKVLKGLLVGLAFSLAGVAGAHAAASCGDGTGTAATGEPIVTLAFKGAGDSAYYQMTKNEATRGTITGAGSNCTSTCAMAIVLDNQIRSWPSIDPTQYPNGINPKGTGAEIRGIGSLSEAKQLALVLQTGADTRSVALGRDTEYRLAGPAGTTVVRVRSGRASGSFRPRPIGGRSDSSPDAAFIWDLHAASLCAPRCLRGAALRPGRHPHLVVAAGQRRTLVSGPV